MFTLMYPPYRKTEAILENFSSSSPTVFPPLNCVNVSNKLINCNYNWSNANVHPFAEKTNLLPLRMVVQDVLHPLSGTYMGVNLCGEDAFVPEHLLYHTQIRTILNKMGCK